MKTRSLSNLVADIRFLAGIEGLTVRYTTAQLERLVNEGYAAYLELIGGNAGRVLRTVEGGQLGAGADYAGWSGAARVRGVALVGDDGEWYELEEATSAQEEDFCLVARTVAGVLVTGEPTITPGSPRFWRLEVQQIASADGVSGSGSVALRFWPPTDRARAMHVIEEPDAPTLIPAAGKGLESLAYFPIPRGDEYVVAWACVKLAIRDADQDRLSATSSLLSKLEEEIRSKKHSFTGGIVSRRDTRLERRINRWRSGV